MPSGAVCVRSGYAPGGYAAVSECLNRSCRLNLDRMIYFPNGRGKFGIYRESRKICFGREHFRRKVTRAEWPFFGSITRAEY